MAQPVNSELFVLLIILMIIVPVSATGSNALESSVSSPYTITLFVPTASMIHSTQIMDMVNVPDAPGSVLLATSFGLSQYNGTWSTRHINRDNSSEGLLNDYVTAIEYDRQGRLWIGYSGGIQIYNGQYYQTIRDQQLLKDPRITALQRWNDDMWVITGNAGIHRYHEGTWTWYQPESDNGPDFYEANGMVVDYASDTLIIATDHEGLWTVRSQEDPIRFECIAPQGSTYGLLTQVRRDPQGGALFFNNSMVAHYTRESNFSSFLSSDMLSGSDNNINDVAAGPDGRIYLATDKGIYIWKNGKIIDFIDRMGGIGTSPTVNWINVDANNRLWFATNDDVGIITDQLTPNSRMTISTVTPTLSPVTDTNGSYPRGVPTSREYIPITTPAPDTSQGSLLNAVTDPIIQAIHAVMAGLGFK